ncbi:MULTISPECIES: lysozyme [Acetobacter]|nr:MULTISPECIES: lysozyme [Acetobacter]ASL41547.1 lysozyme [Acetobacter oryzifermentans]AXC25345.1 lysozyme [Acetobacter sp. JWB]AXC25922.1 lysozyme [Acetobacter sp. JWB]AXN01107.1 lysozyme [Acetobacter pomorum]KAA8391693.1 lysozyme [Acetobacter sp. DmW_125124]
MNDPILLAADLCRRSEGLRLRPYVCPAGYWTIGYGSRFLANGAAVTASTAPITAEYANALLQGTLAKLLPQILRLVRVPLTSGQQAALLDFTYNLGLPALAGSTLLKLLNAGQGNAARNQLLLWNHMHRNGQLITVAGLTLRRRAEWQLWAS